MEELNGYKPDNYLFQNNPRMQRAYFGKEKKNEPHDTAILLENKDRETKEKENSQGTL